MTTNTPIRRKTKSHPLDQSKERPSPPPSSSRRRQWLINKGILSPNPGPTKRLASIFPRVGRNHSSRSKETQSTSDIQVEVNANAVPVVVTRQDRNVHDDHSHPKATRTVSMPPADNRPRTNGLLTRSATQTKNIFNTTNENDRPTAPPGRSSMRFFKRLTSNHRRRHERVRSYNRDSSSRISSIAGMSQLSDMDTRSSVTANDDFHNFGIRRNSFETTTTTATTRRTTSSMKDATRNRPTKSRTIYTVVDRRLPKHILEGDAEFDDNMWKEYRDKIDQLAEDSQFMDYLTATVGKRPPLGLYTAERRRKDAEQLAVNKLYPLAFIRLLEAHAKYSAQNEQTDNPKEEQHRYDDLDGDEDHAVERTYSNGMFDMTRFRAVRVTSKEGMSTSACSITASDLGTSDEIQREGNQLNTSKRFAGLSRQNRTASVPVY